MYCGVHCPAMSAIQKEIKQGRPFASKAAEGVVALLRTTDLLRRVLSGVVEARGITLQQYNVLRILRGAGPSGLPTLEIGQRMVERSPGVTRLLDRLEAKRVVRRKRCRQGRRPGRNHDPVDQASAIRRTKTMKAKPSGTRLRTRLSVLAVLILAAAPLFAAETYTVDKVHSNAQFTIRHLMSKVTGKFTDVEGAVQVDRAQPEASAVEFKIKTASIDTANKQRDDDLRSPNFFDVANHPEITFKSTKVKATGKDSYQVTGTLTMRGVAKEITLPVTVLGEMKDPWGNERIGFEVETTLNRKDYNILWNKTLDSGGYLLGDDVKVTIALEAIKKKEAAAAK